MKQKPNSQNTQKIVSSRKVPVGGSAAPPPRRPSPNGTRSRRPPRSRTEVARFVDTYPVEKAESSQAGTEQYVDEGHAPGEDSGGAGRDLEADDGVLAEKARREGRQRELTYGASSRNPRLPFDGRRTAIRSWRRRPVLHLVHTVAGSVRLASADRVRLPGRSRSAAVARARGGGRRSMGAPPSTHSLEPTDYQASHSTDCTADFGAPASSVEAPAVVRNVG